MTTKTPEQQFVVIANYQVQKAFTELKIAAENYLNYTHDPSNANLFNRRAMLRASLNLLELEIATYFQGKETPCQEN